MNVADVIIHFFSHSSPPPLLSFSPPPPTPLLPSSPLPLLSLSSPSSAPPSAPPSPFPSSTLSARAASACTAGCGLRCLSAACLSAPLSAKRRARAAHRSKVGRHVARITTRTHRARRAVTGDVPWREQDCTVRRELNRAALTHRAASERGRHRNRPPRSPRLAFRRQICQRTHRRQR